MNLNDKNAYHTSAVLVYFYHRMVHAIINTGHKLLGTMHGQCVYIMKFPFVVVRQLMLVFISSKLLSSSKRLLLPRVHNNRGEGEYTTSHITEIVERC